MAWRLSRRGRVICALILIVLGIAPFLSMIAASITADLAGCRLDESGSHPCVILGADRGDLLYTMAVAAWLGLVTLGFAWIGALWLALEAVLAWIARRRRRG